LLIDQQLWVHLGRFRRAFRQSTDKKYEDWFMRNTLSATVYVLALATTCFAQAPAVNVAKAAAPKLLPGTRSSVLSTIEGKALNALNLPMPKTDVRLRDARSGRIVNTTLTDNQGVFVFHEIDPGTYVVELTANKVVVGSSQLLNIGTADAVSATVRVPFQLSALANALSAPSTAAAVSNTAQVVTAAAAASNVAAQTLIGAAATSTSTTNGR